MSGCSRRAIHTPRRTTFLHETSPCVGRVSTKPSSLQLPGRSVWSLQPRAGVLLHRGVILVVPIEPHSEAHGDIAQDAGRRGAEAVFNIAIRLLPRANALNKIRPMQRMRVGDAFHLAGF